MSLSYLTLNLQNTKATSHVTCSVKQMNIFNTGHHKTSRAALKQQVNGWDLGGPLPCIFTGCAMMAWPTNDGKVSNILAFPKICTKLQQVSSPLFMSLSRSSMVFFSLLTTSLRFLYSRGVISFSPCTCCKMTSASSHKVSTRKTLCSRISSRFLLFVAIVQRQITLAGKYKRCERMKDQPLVGKLGITCSVQ